MLLVGVEAIGRLVEDQHLRIMQDRLSQADAALEALGQGLDGLLADVLQFQLRNDTSNPLAPLDTPEAAHAGDEFEEAAHRHVAIARRAFRQIANLPLGLQRLSLHIETEDARRARRRRQETGQHLHGGGLAGAIRAKEAQHLPLLHSERQVIDRRVLRETLR
ncbi:hypothetical protein D9M71_535160 [compost metagenome]